MWARRERLLSYASAIDRSWPTASTHKCQFPGGLKWIPAGGVVAPTLRRVLDFARTGAVPTNLVWHGQRQDLLSAKFFRGHLLCQPQFTSPALYRPAVRWRHVQHKVLGPLAVRLSSMSAIHFVDTVRRGPSAEIADIELGGRSWSTGVLPTEQSAGHRFPSTRHGDEAGLAEQQAVAGAAGP